MAGALLLLMFCATFEIRININDETHKPPHRQALTVSGQFRTIHQKDKKL
jgi:hypothetical protein